VFGYWTHELVIPETHGTITGAEGCEFRYHSGYLSLKFSRGFSAWIKIINYSTLARLGGQINDQKEKF